MADTAGKGKIPRSGLVIGIAIGVAVGVATDNLGLWMAVGIAIGLAIDGRNLRSRKNQNF